MPCFKRFGLLLGQKIPLMPIFEVSSPTLQKFGDFSNTTKLHKCISWGRNLQFHFGFLIWSTIGGYIMIKNRKNYFLIGLEFFETQHPKRLPPGAARHQAAPHYSRRLNCLRLVV